MKKLAGLGLVLVLLALASPTFAAFPTPTPYCWNVEGTSCPSVGATTSCKDACGYNYTCRCISWNGQRYWDCPTVC
jgi:hypothetical protein